MGGWRKESGGGVGGNGNRSDEVRGGKDNCIGVFFVFFLNIFNLKSHFYTETTHANLE